MKKSLVALAALAVAGVASAQSSVTLFGVVDVGVQSVRGQGTGSILRLQGNGSNASSRIGFRGVEDLGGGLRAGFHLEAAINADSGSSVGTNTNNQAGGVAPAGAQGLTFHRRSTISLMGNFGELRLGRDIVPSFYNYSTFDPFGHVGVAGVGALGVSAPGFAHVTSVRASNSIGYFLPGNLGGFYGQAMYAMGENASNVGATENDGRYFGVRFGYANGPLNVALATGNTDYATGDFTKTNVGASYNFGGFRLMGSFGTIKIKNALSPRLNTALLGAVLPVGSGEFKISYVVANQNAGAGNNDASLIGVGYVHNLSKRSAVYTHYGHINNKTGGTYNNGRAPIAGGNSAGFEVGVRHNF